MGLFQLLDRRGIRTTWRGAKIYLFGKRRMSRVHGIRMFFKIRTNALLLKNVSIHKLVRHAEVRFWVDGKDAFRRIERFIRRAKHTIIIEMFIWKDDETGRRIADLLVQAADRGVQVDITKESVGDVFEFAEDFLSTKSRGSGVWKRFWKHNNIHIHHQVGDNHSKTFIIDGEVILLTGMNIGNEYKYDWHDYLVELSGTRFVEQYLTNSRKHTIHDTVQLVVNREGRKELRTALETLLKSAKLSIVIEMAYFSDPAIMDLIAKRSRDGVRVTLIFPTDPDVHHNANLVSIENLLKNGERKKLRILQYPTMLHGKLILVDRHRALVGSMNFTTSSLDQMGEANVLIEKHHKIALQKIRFMLRRDIARSRLIQNPPKLRWLGRWLAWVGL